MCGAEPTAQCVSAKGGRIDIHSARKREAEQASLDATANAEPLAEPKPEPVVVDFPDQPEPVEAAKPAKDKPKADKPESKATRERRTYSDLHDLSNVPAKYHRALGLGVRIAPQIATIVPAKLLKAAKGTNAQDDGSTRYLLTRDGIADLSNWAHEYADSDAMKTANGGVRRSITALVKWTDRLLDEALPVR